MSSRLSLLVTGQGSLPSPEVRATIVPVDDGRVPASAARLAGVGDANGWTVCVSYARGPVGRPGRWAVKDSILLMCHRDGARIHAEWIDGRAAGVWAGGFSSGAGPTTREKVSMVQMRTLLEST